MDMYENVGLWKRTLGHQPGDSDEKAREKLRVAYQNFRSRVSTLVGEINRILPTLTVHDITHLDALWEMANIVAGDNFELTPAEAFVLGGGILLHDAGMAVAAYPQGWRDIECDELWRDILAGILRRNTGKAPSAEALKYNGPQKLDGRWC